MHLASVWKGGQEHLRNWTRDLRVTGAILLLQLKPQGELRVQVKVTYDDK